MKGADFAAGIYRAMADDQLAHAIGKLRRLVRSLERQRDSLARGYREALETAVREQESRKAGGTE